MPGLHSLSKESKTLGIGRTFPPWVHCKPKQFGNCMIGSTVRVWFGSKIRVWQLGGLARGDLFTTLLKLCVKYLWYRKDILLVLSPQNDFKVSWGHAGGRGVHYYWVFRVCPYEIRPKCIFFYNKTHWNIHKLSNTCVIDWYFFAFI